MCPGIGGRGPAPDGLIICVQVLGAGARPLMVCPGIGGRGPAPDGLIMCVQVLGA